MLAEHPAGTAGIRYGSAPGDLRSWHVLWALLAGYAWLMPTREPPWRSFYADALAAVAVAVLAVGLSVVHRRRGLPAPTAVPFMLFIACIPAVQVLAGMQFFAGSAWMASAYAFGFAVAILVGALWHEADADRAVDTLFLALAIPAVVTAAMMIYQWLGLDGMTMWVRPISASGRPAGNLGQPNQAAMLCMWGLIGLGWLCWRRKLHGALAASLGALLVAGMVLTQSRGIVLQAAALGVALLVWRRQLADRRLIVGLGLMALLYAGLFWGLHLLGREASEATLRPSDEMLQPGGRLLGWWYVVEALIRHPWAGYGWGQMTLAHYEVALDQPALREYFQYAHNIVLDILAWNGVPLGLLVLAGPAWWFVSRARRVAADLRYAQSRAIGTRTIHGLHFEPSSGRYTVYAPTPSTPLPDPADRARTLRVAFDQKVEYRGVAIASASMPVVIGLDPVEPFELLRTAQLGLRSFGPLQEEV